MVFVFIRQQSINPYHTYRVDQYINQQHMQPQRLQQTQSNQFYLHDNTSTPQPAVRRTWIQPAAALNTDVPQHQQVMRPRNRQQKMEMKKSLN